MQNKFKIGDALTVADPKDPSHFKRFQEVVGTLPVEEGLVPYSLKSYQTGRILGPHELNEHLPQMIEDDKRGLYTFRSMLQDHSSPKAYFETMYRALTEEEKIIYLNE